ncbi:MAG: hypothetical protein Q8R18_02500 [bacterium]|nr:hypothetical protein [bacterium]
MKKTGTWLKENYQLVIAFILFMFIMIALTREGSTFFDAQLGKAIQTIKNIFI